MKNQRDIYQALIDGKQLKYDNGMLTYQLNSDGLLLCTNRINGSIDRVDMMFDDFEKWEIYEEPKWYDNIPENGVICWVWDGEAKPKNLAVVIKKVDFSGFNFVIANGSNWIYATPVKPDECYKEIKK